MRDKSLFLITTSIYSGLLFSKLSKKDIYAVLGFKPALSFDFANEYYRTNSTATTFDNALTATRAGNATMVDSDGKIKWAPHNLLAYSEQFDNGAWVKSGATVAADTTVAPNGDYVADTLTASGTNVSISRAFTLLPVSHTIVVWAKAGTASWIRIGQNSSAVNAAYFNLSTGAVGTVVGAGNSATITNAGDGWFKCTFICVSPVTSSTNIFFGQTDADGDVAVTVGKTVHIWGAHLYRSDLGGMVDVPADARAIPSATKYVPTTSAARYLPRRGHHVYNGSAWVNEGLLVESEARTNLETQSVSLANYVAVVAGGATTTYGQPDPFGGSTAGLYTSTMTNGYTYGTIVSTSAANYTFSVWLKSDSVSSCRIQLGAGATSSGVYADVDMANGTIGAATLKSGSYTPITSSIQDFGNGWYRASVTATLPAGSNVGYLQTISPSGATFYFYGAQLEAGSTPSSYIPTAGATTTRAAETLVIPSANLPWPSPTALTSNLYSGADPVNIVGPYTFLPIIPSDSRTKVLMVEWTQTINTGTRTRMRYRNAADTADIWPITYYNGSGSFKEVIVTSSGLKWTQIDGPLDVDLTNISVKEINPLAVSIAMDGRMTYADTGSAAGKVNFVNWLSGGSNYIQDRIDTSGSGTTGTFTTIQNATGTIDFKQAIGAYSPGINVPFSIASRHGSTFINGAVDGVALTADLTPVALPALSATNLQLGYAFMGTIGSFRIWADDIGDTGIAEASA